MIIAVIILAWLLICTWTTVIFIGVDEKWDASEWAGMVVACLCSPICVFIIRPIVRTIKRAKKNKKREDYFER